MIYQIQKPLMIVGYLFLILISRGVYSAPGDFPTGNTSSLTTPSANTAIQTSVITSTQETVAIEPNLEIDNESADTEAVEQITPIPVEASPKSKKPLKPKLETSSESNKAELVQTLTAVPQALPENVRSVKPIDGLEIPDQIQSKIIPTNQSSDVRVIIDISGSMKENDAENVRIPALNLIVEMLPEGAQAGVWTFGQWVNMLIAPAKVDEKWRENAKKQAKKINSHGLRTNIGEAMEKATWKFEKDGDFDQHVILLTDGLVDIAKDSDPKKQQKDEAERQRISTSILKQYQDLGVKIHSIALSDKADKSLLERLALETQGTSEVVNSSADLVKAFLKAFEQAAPEVAEQVPLSKDNTFEIDASVQEFTALVFKKAGSAPTQLVSPSGEVVSQIKASENSKWFGESLYDLVTLTTPEPGKWKIEADLDPDNQVTVVSDLKMEIANLPTTLFPGQQVDFEVYLHEDGEIISNPDFLKLMTIEMTMTAESGRSGTKAISDPKNVPQDGRYKESIKRLSKEGQYELKVNVDGKTFQRMRKEYIQVRQPIGFEIRKRMVNDVEAYAVRVIPQVPDIEVARTRVIAKLKGPDSTSIIQAMPWIEEGVWEAIIEPNKGPGEYKIAMNVKGRFAEDQEFRIKPDPIVLSFPIPADFSHEYYVKEEMQEVAMETEPDSAPEVAMPDLSEKMKEQAANEPEVEKIEEPVAAEEPSEPEASEDKGESEVEEANTEDEEVSSIPSWVFILIPVLTILLGVGGFFVYRMMAKKKAAANASTTTEPSTSEAKGAEVSLNDGMDDEDFDEDFDLSDSDDDEELIAAGGDLDDLDGLDLSNDDDLDSLDDLGDMPDMDEPDMSADAPAEEVKDEIPDFDENFDIEADAEPEPPIVDTPEEKAAALDELDSVLDDLSAEDEENIPQLDSDASPETAEPEPAPAAEDDLDIGADLDIGDALDEAPEEELEGEAAVDAALANLENELEDLDLGEEPKE